MKLDHKTFAFTAVRVAAGLLFFMAGLGKLRGGIGGFVTGMTNKFKGHLPEFLVWPFATALPFLELGIGLLLIAGLYTRWALVSAVGLMLLLFFGATALGDGSVIGPNFTYLAIVAALLFYVDGHEAYSADAYLKQRRR